MNVQFDPDFLIKLKKQNVRIRNSFKKNIAIFIQNPYAPELNNHALHREWLGFNSIDITADWRAIFQIIKNHNETLAYFVALGTHNELYST